MTAAEQHAVRISAVVPVYNDAARALRAVERLRAQRLPAGSSLEIVTVDDGSEAAERALLRDGLPEGVHLLLLPKNVGRSAACQAGIDAVRGDLMLLLDCDCEPLEDDFLARHVDAFTPTTVATVGPLVGVDGRFWDRYQREGSRRRKALFESGIPYAGTTANAVFRVPALRAAGGFNPSYRSYGFEDRDLLIRLTAFGDIVWCDEAVVRHLDEITMTSVSRKMRVAGKDSARLFAKQHPAAYKALGYAALDVECRPWLRWIAPIFGASVDRLSAIFDALERRNLLPWKLAFVTARLLGATSFLVGTSMRDTDVRSPTYRAPCQ